MLPFFCFRSYKIVEEESVLLLFLFNKKNTIKRNVQNWYEFIDFKQKLARTQYGYQLEEVSTDPIVRRNTMETDFPEVKLMAVYDKWKHKFLACH